ncbi:MAG: hypothetical protein RAP70_10905 [Candidatus Celaenobacter antarcticus]|nr:hypothetical protein [Candidatus Celaenobacter antarcticus]MDP8315561.1 hypothetical protein [Candidatus Celaenobacter antarcticus]
MNKKEKSHPVSKKKQTVGIIVFSIMILLLTGCFNITQHISKEGNDLNVFIKFAVSKSIFEMSSSMGGKKSDDNPCEDIFKYNEESIINGFPKNIKARFVKADNDLECGYEMYMSVDVKSKDYKKLKRSNAPALFPLVGDGEIYIKFPQGEEDGGGDQMSAAFMSTALYRLTVNRNVIDEIESVTFKNADESYDISYIELPDIFIIEVPLAYWIASSSTCELIIK